MNVEVDAALFLLDLASMMVVLQRRILVDLLLIVEVLLRFRAAVLASHAEALSRVSVTSWRLLMV